MMSPQKKIQNFPIFIFKLKLQEFTHL